MKGRSSNACRSNGGTTKMRSIGGFKAPLMGENEHVLKEARGKTTGIVKMDGPEGTAAKGRLDRPGRKHGGKVHHMEHQKKHGGHVKHEDHEEHHKHGINVKKKVHERKADGGGISDYLSRKGSDKNNEAQVNAGKGMLAGAAAPGLGTLGIPVGAYALGKFGQAIGDAYEGYKFSGAANKFKKSGLPERPSGDDGDNGRKNGGRPPMHLDIKKGALRAELGVKEGEKIPTKKLEKATHSDNPTLKKRAVLAENMRHWKKG